MIGAQACLMHCGKTIIGNQKPNSVAAHHRRVRPQAEKWSPQYAEPSFDNPSRVTVRISSDAFEDRAGDPGPVSFETLGKVADQLFGLIGVVQLPCLSQHAPDRSMQRFGQSLHNVAGLVDLTALDRRGASEGSADRLGQGLRAVDDEEPRHRRVDPALDEIVNEGLDGRGVLMRPR